ncbi:MAG: NlpC/P60 family protein [Dolichospermum sp.]
MLTSQIKRQIIQKAIATPDVEVCGVILDNDEIVQMNNCANEPKHEFLINEDEFDLVADSAVGIYHSHCLESQPATLSPKDIANSKARKIPYVLYHTLFEEWDYYDPNNIYPYPLIPNPWLPKELPFYLGWKFSYNRSDCYTLIRSYYKGMLGINLPDFPRNNIQETTSPSWDMFAGNFEKAGFRKLGTDEMLRTNDVILMCISGTQTHHSAILLDTKDNKALHNLGEGRMSDLFMYGGYWETATRFVCRYDSIHHN